MRGRERVYAACSVVGCGFRGMCTVMFDGNFYRYMCPGHTERFKGWFKYPKSYYKPRLAWRVERTWDKLRSFKIRPILRILGAFKKEISNADGR